MMATKTASYNESSRDTLRAIALREVLEAI